MVDGWRLFDGCSPDATLRVGFASLVCISIVKWAHKRLHKWLMNKHMHSKRIPFYRSVMYKLHLQRIYTDLILFSFLPPNSMFKEGPPWDHQMPHHWQFCPFNKEKQASRGPVFPGLEKRAGPRVGLDFRAQRGRSSGEAGKARRALSLAPEVAGPAH